MKLKREQRGEERGTSRLANKKGKASRRQGM